MSTCYLPTLNAWPFGPLRVLNISSYVLNSRPSVLLVHAYSSRNGLDTIPKLLPTVPLQPQVLTSQNNNGCGCRKTSIRSLLLAHTFRFRPVANLPTRISSLRVRSCSQSSWRRSNHGGMPQAFAGCAGGAGQSPGCSQTAVSFPPLETACQGVQDC